MYPHSLTPEPQYEAVRQRTRGIGMVTPCFTKANKHTRHWSAPFSNCPFHHLRVKVLSWLFFPLLEKTAQIIAYWEIQPHSCWIPCSWNRPALADATDPQLPQAWSRNDQSTSSGQGLKLSQSSGCSEWKGECPQTKDSEVQRHNRNRATQAGVTEV